MRINQKKQKRIKAEGGLTPLRMSSVRLSESDSDRQKKQVELGRTPLRYFLVKKVPKFKFSFKFVRE